MADLVSVIIPVYNHAGILKLSLNSVLNQTHRPLEVIVVNDGSTDDFESEIKDIILDHRYDEINIKVINQKNKGAPSARNRGFAESSGRFVIFWDADTIGEPSMIRKMLRALVENAGAAYAYGGFKFGWKKFKSNVFSADALKQNNFIDVTSLIRREYFTGFDETLKRFQDWDLWLTLLEKNNTGIFVPEILYKKVVGNRAGISRWLPKFAYSLPFKWRVKDDYQAKKAVVLEKHGLLKRL